MIVTTTVDEGIGMGLFKRKSQPAPEPSSIPVDEGPEQAVILRYSLSEGEYGTVAEREAIFALEDRLMNLIESQQLGEHDGNEFGGGEAVIYCYGPDAERLFAGIESEARAFPARPAFAQLRFGDVSAANAREERIDL